MAPLYGSFPCRHENPKPWCLEVRRAAAFTLQQQPRIDLPAPHGVHPPPLPVCILRRIYATAFIEQIAFITMLPPHPCAPEGVP